MMVSWKENRRMNVAIPECEFYSSGDSDEFVSFVPGWAERCNFLPRMNFVFLVRVCGKLWSSFFRELSIDDLLRFVQLFSYHSFHRDYFVRNFYVYVLMLRFDEGAIQLAGLFRLLLKRRLFLDFFIVLLQSSSGEFGHSLPPSVNQKIGVN